MSTFSTAYSQLNPEQRRAVDHLDGPLMVIAGPGTGKTQVMAVRIGTILQKTDTPPRAILALTFTDSATKNLRQRLVDLLGTTGYQVPIHTFHSFCSTVIQDCPEYFSFNRDSQALTELEKYQILSDILAAQPFVVLKPLNAPDLYLRELNSNISNLKREGMLPEDFAKLVAAERTFFNESESELSKTERNLRLKRLVKQEELATVFREYQRIIAERSQFDFEDMISAVNRAFQEEPDLLAEYQERFLYFLVDEYQDTNSAQNQVVDALASFWGDAANVFVVGDPHQSIYRFQGASVENMLNFTQRYPRAEVITLTEGYRCPQSLYDTAARLISFNQRPELRASSAEVETRLSALWSAATQPLTSHASGDSPVKRAEMVSHTQELVYIAKRIRSLIEEGVSPDAIAVLYRHNQDQVDLLPLLAQFEIPFSIDGGSDVLKIPTIQQWQLLLEVITQWQQGAADQRIYQVLQQPWWELEPTVVMKLARAAHQSRTDWWSVLSSREEKLLEWEPMLTPQELQPALVVTTHFQQWSSMLMTTPLTAWLRMVLSESGLLKWMSNQPNRIELLTASATWLEYIEGWVQRQPTISLVDVLKALQMMAERKIILPMDSISVGESAVSLSTVHKAKGQEWEYVFILHAVDGKWGNNYSRDLLPLPEGILQLSQTDDHNELEDERRLMYVALTRAKKQVVLCVPQMMVSNGKSREVVPSQFVTEVASMVVPEEDQALSEARAQDPEQLLALLQPVASTRWGERERQYLLHLTANFKLSASALNCYLESPADFITKYLLRVPTVIEPQLEFGTAIHKALEVWHKAWMERGEQPAATLLQTTFAQTLQSAPLDQAELARRLKYGEQVLQRFYHHLQETDQPPLYVEKQFGKGSSQSVLGDVVLTGRIDQVDWIDQTAKTVCLVDYKTGRAKTPGHIFATDKASFGELSPREQQLPESIRGRYQRQLVFYRLLTDLDPTFKLQVQEGMFVFVEPDKESGKITTRRVELTSAAVEDLKQLITDVMQEIRSLSFLDTLSANWEV